LCRDANTCAGLSYGYGSQYSFSGELGYNWTDSIQTWGWNSALFVPDEKWVFVALTVEPEKATLSMVDEGVLYSATNEFEHEPEEFDGTTYVAWAPFLLGGVAYRYFRGWMDDVRIYDTVLTS
jgi:hypothetical protein